MEEEKQSTRHITRLNTAYANAKAQGKVLDVSAINENGTNFKTMPKRPPPKSHKKGIDLDEVPLVSDNHGHYVLALELLGIDLSYGDSYFRKYGESAKENPGAHLHDLLIKAEEEGRVVDVSKLDEGILRIVNKPMGKGGGKKMIGDFAIISNNGANYEQAIQLLEERQALADEFIRLYGRGVMIRSPAQKKVAKSPRVKKSPTRQVSPKKKLSPVAKISPRVSPLKVSPRHIHISPVKSSPGRNIMEETTVTDVKPTGEVITTSKELFEKKMTPPRVSPKVSPRKSPVKIVAPVKTSPKKPATLAQIKSKGTTRTLPILTPGKKGVTPISTSTTTTTTTTTK